MLGGRYKDLLHDHLRHAGPGYFQGFGLGVKCGWTLGMYLENFLIGKTIFPRL
jgi:hypothetical protein